MGKEKAFLCVASFIAFVVLSVDQTYKNQQIQSQTPQQQQAFVQRAQKNINSALNGVEDFLKKPLVACIIQDLTRHFVGNHKPSDGWQCAMNALQKPSR